MHRHHGQRLIRIGRLIATLWLGLGAVVALGAERKAAPESTSQVSQQLDQVARRATAGRIRLEPTATSGLSRLVGVKIEGRRVRLLPSAVVSRAPLQPRELEYERPRQAAPQALPIEPADVPPLGALEAPPSASSGMARLAGNPGDAEHPREAPPPPPDFSEPPPPPDSSKPPPPPADAFTVFRNQQVHSAQPTVLAPGKPNAITFNAEPSAANIGGTILTTGNNFAKVSEDNALSYLVDRQPSGALQGFPGGGFCCDQVAYTAPRPGGEPLLAWVAQTWPSTTNTIVLFTFAGESALRSASACAYGFTAPFIVPTGASGWLFDRPRVASTERFLFLTFDYGLINGGPEGSFIVRMKLDDLFDNDRSGCLMGDVEMDVLTEEGDPGVQPVKGAASTMFLARHHWKVGVGDMLRIYAWPDAASEPAREDRNVHNYAYNRAADCSLNNGSNPCGRVQGTIETGFRAGTTVGWLWTAQQGSGRPYPYVRVAVFESSTLDKVVDTDIWHSEFAWAYPSAGVNGQGNVGVILYQMGGLVLPTARAFIVKQPRQGWPPPETNPLPNGRSTAPPPADPKAVWGDYGSVNRYDGCPATFLGTAYSLAGATAVARTYWFGDGDEACADLQADRLEVVATSTGGAHPGDQVTLSTRLRNSGARDAGASRVAFYLSADAVRDSSDVVLGPIVFSTGLEAGASRDTPTITATIPGNVDPAVDPYTVFACADYLDQVSEISEANNCDARSMQILFR